MESGLDKVLRLAPEPGSVLLSVVRSYVRYERGRAERVRESQRENRSGGRGRGGFRVSPWGAVNAGQLLFHGGSLFRSLGKPPPSQSGTKPAGASSSKSSKSSRPWVNYPAKTNGAVTFNGPGWTPGPEKLPPDLALQQSMLGGRVPAPGAPSHTAVLQHVASGKKHTVTLPADHKVTVAGGG